MRRLFVVIIAALGGLAVLIIRAEPFAPSVDATAIPERLGHKTPVAVTVRDRGTGLAAIELRITPAAGGAPVVAARETFPRVGFFGSGVHEIAFAPTVDASALGLVEGPARLEVYAVDHSWVGGFRSAPRLSRDVTIDLTAPTLGIATSRQVGRQGGAECVIYRVGDDTTRDGVQVGELFFPGVAALFAEPALHAAIFALPHDAPSIIPRVLVEDAAGNTRTQAVDITVKPRTFADKSLPITEQFLARKVPELLSANGLPPTGDLVAGYLTINRTLRATTEERLRDVAHASIPRRLWEGAFVRLPNGAPLSGFADHRAYLHAGKIIDEQTHLGYDLASLERAVVPAANTGRVVFGGSLGIYGDTVVIDHGLGVFTLYGHLSSISVKAGQDIRRGDPIGQTGTTGLAAGDHLHFSTMIRGIHVDPVEWWDAHWITDHVEGRLAGFPAIAAAEPRP